LRTSPADRPREREVPTEAALSVASYWIVAQIDQHRIDDRNGK